MLEAGSLSFSAAEGGGGGPGEGGHIPGIMNRTEKMNGHLIPNKVEIYLQHENVYPPANMREASFLPLQRRMLVRCWKDLRHIFLELSG